MQIQTASDSGFTTNLTSVDDVPLLFLPEKNGGKRVSKFPPDFHLMKFIVCTHDQLVDLFGLRVVRCLLILVLSVSRTRLPRFQLRLSMAHWSTTT